MYELQCVSVGKAIEYIQAESAMTSRELTSGFDQLHMAVMHLSTKFGANIFLQSGNIDICLNSIWLQHSPEVCRNYYRIYFAYVKSCVD